MISILSSTILHYPDLYTQSPATYRETITIIESSYCMLFWQFTKPDDMFYSGWVTYKHTLKYIYVCNFCKFKIV